MKRSLQKFILKDLDEKIVIISGPRQCGKTTLSKNLDLRYQYLNYDLVEHRLLLKDKSWDREKDLIILDELHKMTKWKSWVKGIYDVEGVRPRILVTGSAKLAAFKKVGDSLAGRHFHYRLHPIDIKEACQKLNISCDEAFQRLMSVGGFPEPFLKGNTAFYQRWKRTHIDLILKEDVRELSKVQDIKSIETMIELMRSRVGSPLSIRSLALDLEKDPKTIKRWIELLENLYVVFKITPYHKNIARSQLKGAKYYFYDVALVKDEPARLENLVACSLLKEIQYKQDTEGADLDLKFLRKKGGVEIDFLVTRGGLPHIALEVKSSDPNLSKSFKQFLARDNSVKKIQLTLNIKQAKSYPTGERVVPLKDYLAGLSIN